VTAPRFPVYVTRDDLDTLPEGPMRDRLTQEWEFRRTEAQRAARVASMDGSAVRRAAEKVRSRAVERWQDGPETTAARRRAAGTV